MTADRAALVAGILANPDDDTPRLVAADWFEENGDSARGEFIRVQVNRARLPPTDPQQPELAARELRLLKEHAERWMGAHFAFKKCRFRRGFIEYVHLHLTHFLHHRRELLALEPVRDISLTGWMRATASLVSRVAGCEELRHIETLRFHHQGPHKHPRGECAILLDSPHLTGLKKLHFTMISVTTEERRRIERSHAFARASDIMLPYMGWLPDDPGGWFSNGVPAGALANARALRVGGSSLPEATLNRLAAHACWKRLEELTVRIGWSQPPAIEALSANLPPNVRTLRLNGGQQFEAGDAAVGLFERAGALPLQELELRALPLSADSLGALLSGKKTLRRFAIDIREYYGDQEFSEDALRVVASAPALREVSELQLVTNGTFTADAAEALFAPGNMPNLVSLDLIGTGLGEAGARALAAAEFPALQRLKFSGFSLPETQLRAVLRSKTCKNLVALHYSGAGWNEPEHFSPACAAALAKLPYLSSVRLEVEKVTEELREPLANVPWLHVGSENRENWGDYDPNVCAPIDDELKHADQGG